MLFLSAISCVYLKHYGTDILLIRWSDDDDLDMQAALQSDVMKTCVSKK